MNRRAKRHAEPLSEKSSTNWGLGLAVLLGFAVLGYAVFSGLQRSPPDDPAPAAAPPDLSQAMALLSQGRLDEAEYLLRLVLEQTPTATSARDELRWICFNQFRTREVEAILEDGLKRSPENLSNAVDLLMSEFRPQNPRELLKYWERIEGRRPGQPNPSAALGYCYWKLGRIDEARQKLQAALDLRPDDFRLQVLAAEFLIDSGADETSDPIVSALQQRLDKESSEGVPPNPLPPATRIYADRVWWLRSLRAESANDATGALAFLDKAIELRPQEPSYLQRRGALLLDFGRKQEAAACFASANQLEGYVGRLTEIVLGSELEHLTPELCRELAEISEQRGRPIQAEAWQRAVKSTER